MAVIVAFWCGEGKHTNVPPIAPILFCIDGQQDINLFAALNILEPLYEVCITRMQDWNVENPKLFEDELRELNVKYRSNIRYFIYKSIILRNLYGVDIMVEATEIAKLRLFLKMVAVVDVNPRDPNLGLDPLPDIDFNIRCGNTLVGYATEGL